MCVCVRVCVLLVFGWFGLVFFVGFVCEGTLFRLISRKPTEPAPFLGAIWPWRADGFGPEHVKRDGRSPPNGAISRPETGSLTPI